MKKDAVIDKSGKYRYMLLRQWGDDKDNFVNFVMLNPNTADDKVDDRTIKKCIKFAKKWNYDGFYVTNLFALRSKDPKKLKTTKEPIGKENDHYIEKYAKSCKLIVAAWGDHGILLNRGSEVMTKLKKFTTPHCIRQTKLHQPIHPLYQPKDAIPIKF